MKTENKSINTVDNTDRKVYKYRLKEGVILRPNGVHSKIDNSNLTDEIAEMLIEKGRASEEDFIINKQYKIIKK